MITTEATKVKNNTSNSNNNNNNNNNYDIFHFFLEYQQGNEQRDEQERGIPHI
jgi:hypothetical protein